MRTGDRGDAPPSPRAAAPNGNTPTTESVQQVRCEVRSPHDPLHGDMPDL